MIDAIKRHPTRTKVATIFFIISILFIIFYIILKQVFGIDCIRIYYSEEEQQIVFFNFISLNNCLTLLTLVGMIIGAMWALIQYDRTTKLRQQEKASEIAKSFSEELTIKCSIICEVFKNSELGTFLKLDTKDYESFCFFNTNEIRSIYNDDNFIEKYRQKLKEADLNQIYYRILDSRISFNSFKLLTENNRIYSEKEAQELFTLNNSNFPFKFSALATDVLNELEYLCMSLSSQAAGSKYVYQSLHQVFLRTIRTLSLEISISNENCYTDKYYTSIINVYNEWTSLYIKQLEKEKKQKKKVNKILEPKLKTV